MVSLQIHQPFIQPHLHAAGYGAGDGLGSAHPRMLRECSGVAVRKAMRVERLPRIRVLRISALGFWVARMSTIQQLDQQLIVECSGPGLVISLPEEFEGDDYPSIVETSPDPSIVTLS